MKKKVKLKDLGSNCRHEKIYASYVLTSYPLRHSWVCKKCGLYGVDVGYNVIGLSYEELLRYFPSMKQGIERERPLI